MNCIENFGLEFLTETEEGAMALCGAVCTEGKAIIGYYGYPYINQEYGWPQFIVRTGAGKDGNLTVTGMDTHLSGETTWRFKIRHAYKACENDDPLTRKVMAYKPEDGSGAAIITLVNADVLPSFLEDDEISAQMIGFPLQINYYESEEAYAEDQPEMLNEKKMLFADGAIFPIGLFKDKEVKNNEEENLMLIRGEVKKAQRGLLQFGEEKAWNYIDVIIGTQFGDLEIVHTLEQVEEPGRNLIKEGNIVSGVFVLSGDVAIDKYKDGIVRDFEHNLAALRYTVQEGEAERLESILSDEAEYVSEWARTTYCGKKEIIRRLNFVKASNPHCDFYTHFATIISIDDGEEELAYDVGERCIVIAMESPDNYESICFMECNEENKITKIVVTCEPRYHFQVDKKVEYDDLFDFTLPDNWYESILSRSHYHNFLDMDISEKEVENQSTKTDYYRKVAEAVAENMKETPADDILEFLPKLYGYMFVKSIELQLSNNNSNTDLTYSVDDFNMERIERGYEPKIGQEYMFKRLNSSYELGMQFYKDFAFQRERLKTEDGFDEDLIASLVFVQQIGEVYAKTKLNNFRKE